MVLRFWSGVYVLLLLSEWWAECLQSVKGRISGRLVGLSHKNMLSLVIHAGYDVHCFADICIVFTEKGTVRMVAYVAQKPRYVVQHFSDKWATCAKVMRSLHHRHRPRTSMMLTFEVWESEIQGLSPLRDGSMFSKKDIKLHRTTGWFSTSAQSILN